MTGVSGLSQQFVSYAQNFEDVLLMRCFADVSAGVYVDVGAHHPVIDSVTEIFYQRGWRGLNVDASSAHAAAMARMRPRDANRYVAVGESAGEIEFFEVPYTGLSTTSAAYADRHREQGFDVVSKIVERRTLSQLCEEAGIDEIDFLKIDVEGDEAAVISGFDLERWRPKVVLVEATEPNSQTRSDGWSALLEAGAYRQVWFDGLNIFFVAQEHAALAARIAAPPNVFDGYVLARSQALHRYLTDLRFRRWTEVVQGHLAAGGDPQAERAAIVDATNGDWSAEAVFALALARPPNDFEARAWNDEPCADEGQLGARIALLMDMPEYRALMCAAWSLPALAPASRPIERDLRAAERAARLANRENEALRAALADVESDLEREASAAVATTAQLEALRRQIAIDAERLKTLDDQNVTLVSRLRQVQARADELSGSQRLAEHERDAAISRLEAADAQHRNVAKRLADTERALSDAHAHARALSDTIRLQTEAFDSVRRDFEQRAQTFAAQDGLIAAAQAQRDAAERAVSETREALTKAEQSLTAMQAERAAIQTQLDHAQREREALQAVAAETQRELELWSARARAAEAESGDKVRTLIAVDGSVRNLLATAMSHAPAELAAPASLASDTSDRALTIRLQHLETLLEAWSRRTELALQERQFLLEQIQAAVELASSSRPPRPSKASLLLVPPAAESSSG